MFESGFFLKVQVNCDSQQDPGDTLAGMTVDIVFLNLMEPAEENRIQFLMYTINRLFYLSHRLFRAKVPLLPGLISFAIRQVYGADLHPQAQLGSNVVFSHAGLGIIIHPRAIIGNNVTIGAQTIIGCNLKDFGVPYIGNNVFIGPGAKVLGQISIGHNVFIGANAVVLSSIPDNSVAAGMPARVVRELSQEEIKIYWPSV